MEEVLTASFGGKTERNYGIDLLRMVSMFFIYVVCSLIDFLRSLLFKSLKLKPSLSKAEEKIKSRILEREVPKE